MIVELILKPTSMDNHAGFLFIKLSGFCPIWKGCMNEKIIAVMVDTGNLTPRESEIAALVCEGLSDKAIARVLAISIKTLSTHLEHIYIKLQVRQHSVNVRCSALATMVARGMVRLSTSALCLLLSLSMLSFDDNSALRTGRIKTARAPITRSREC